MNKLEIGCWNKFPHYAVVGEPTDFYVWVNLGEPSTSIYRPAKSGASGWLKGVDAFREYGKLKQLFKKDRDGFVALLLQLHKGYAPKR